ncbi:MAG: PAS domain-containing hybrid sensor histidine kinase/response regulator [Burkholderiaceae bacterium]
MTVHTPPSPSSPPADVDQDRFELLVRSVRDYAIFMLDPEGRVLTWNAGAEAIQGWTAEEIVGRSFETFYPPDAVAAGWPKTELRLAAQRGRFEDLGWRVRKDGSRIWANVVITALRGPAGDLVGFAKVTRDLTESRRQQEALRQSEEQLRLLVESVKDYALFMLDVDGCVLTWNAGAAAILGYSAGDVIGRHFSMFFAPDDRAAGRAQEELELARDTGRAHAQGWRMRKDGSTFWADVRLTAVHDASGQLRGFAKVTQDLTEQRRLAELEGTSRRMTSFLAMLAHELRNPLAPIRNAASVLQMQPELPPVLERVRDVVDRQARHLSRLVDDLLDVGRIATGKIVLRLEPMDYRDVVDAAIEAFAPAIAAKGQTLELDLIRHPLPMTGDATRLMQVLQNVLGNAVRYVPPGGRIRVEMAIEHASVVTRVIDDGPGIAPEALERIFELFVQEDAARLPSDSGLGIGLSLARALVAQHGGLITAQSTGLGHGATFTIRLPLVASRAPAAPDPTVAGRAAPRRVLVVDDNADAADSMGDMLRLMGHEVLVAHAAGAALAQVDAFAPDWAMLDLNMPDMDGCTLLRALRERPGLADLRAAAVTGYGQPQDRERSLVAGFDAHLIKPVEIAQVGALMASP